MIKSLARIVGFTIIGNIVLILLSLFYMRANGLTNSQNIFDITTSQSKFEEGVVLVTLKPYTDIKALDEYLRQNPGLNRKQDISISFPSFGALSLKGYQSLNQKIIGLGEGMKNNPEILKAQKQLHVVYENLKTNRLLSGSNIWDSFYDNLEPEKSYFAVIHYFFKPGISKAERENFFRSYPLLEIVDDKEESRTYSVIVPKGKENYWLGQLSVLPFVKTAWLNSVLHIDSGKSPSID
jgi:hypothetical protein